MLRSTKTLEPVANRLLAALPGKEYQRLRPHLEEGPLAFGKVLYVPGEIIQLLWNPPDRLNNTAHSPGKCYVYETLRR
jgi:hypothetical protein